MIDQRFQGQGYARAAMEQVIQQLVNQHNCEAVFISYLNNNHVAQKLYHSLGFVEQNVNNEKVLARLDLSYTADTASAFSGSLPLTSSR